MRRNWQVWVHIDAAKMRERWPVPGLYRCTVHQVLIRPGRPVEWRPL